MRGASTVPHLGRRGGGGKLIGSGHIFLQFEAEVQFKLSDRVPGSWPQPVALYEQG